MEARLGTTIRDDPTEGDQVISSEEVLLAEAGRAIEGLKSALLAEVVKDADGPAVAARLIDAPREAVMKPADIPPAGDA